MIFSPNFGKKNLKKFVVKCIKKKNNWEQLKPSENVHLQCHRQKYTCVFENISKNTPMHSIFGLLSKYRRHSTVFFNNIYIMYKKKP